MTRIVALLSLTCVLAPACGGNGMSDGPGPNPNDPDAGASVADASPASPDAAPPIEESCPAEFIGSGDGCDCGCGVTDPDCPVPMTADDCAFDNCGDTAEVDPADPTQCIAKVLPAGWTCSAYAYGEDSVCSCGCGVLDDKDCPADLEIADCYYFEHGCPAGQWPDPNDPTGCAPEVAGWTCNWKSYYGDSCTCGCGIADPGCQPNMHISDCTTDGCPTGESPDPQDVTQCIDNAPQDSWSCDLALLNDGSTCDCGCGALDPDCPAGAMPSSCDVVHCGSKDELKPGTITECWEICEPLTETVGNATCTNGGFIEIFSSCERNLSACSDGNSYEVECTAGECECRVNGQCVSHETGSCSLDFTCGWNLVDAT